MGFSMSIFEWKIAEASRNAMIQLLTLHKYPISNTKLPSCKIPPLVIWFVVAVFFLVAQLYPVVVCQLKNKFQSNSVIGNHDGFVMLSPKHVLTKLSAYYRCVFISGNKSTTTTTKK